MSAGGSAHIVTLAIRARQVLPSITFIVIHGLARLSWSAAECADVGIDMTWAHAQQPECRGWAVGSLWARRVFHIVGI